MVRGQPDFYFIFTVFALVGFGLVMVLSSSLVTGFRIYQDSFYFFKRHLFSAGLGILFFFIGLNFNYFNLKKLAFLIFGATVILLLMVYFPGVSWRAGGASRWLKIWFFSFQPSELAKLSFIIFISYLLSGLGQKISNFKKGIFPVLMLTFPILFLIIKQPDFGTAFIIMGLFLALLFLAGARGRHLLLIIFIMLFLGMLVIAQHAYQQRRLLAFLNPWKDPLGSGFHLIQSLLAVGSGGLWGLGLGASRQKYAYLPLHFTDFIFAIICEELGFVGAVIVILLFVFLAIRGFRIARGACDNFGKLLAAGLTFWFVFQAVINIGVVVGIFPVTGIPLSFISFGGTALFTSLWSAGILGNISRFRRK